MTFELTHLSYSSRKTLLECGKKYELTKIHGAPDLPSWALPGGSAVHRATEIIDKQTTEETWDGMSDLRRGREASEGSAANGWPVDADLPGVPGHTPITVFGDAFADATSESMERNSCERHQFRATGRGSKEWPQGRDEVWWLTFGPLMVAAYVDWRLDTRWGLPPAPSGETPVELGVNATLGYPTKGSIDRVFQLPSGDLCVADLKTGTSKNHPLQLGEYATQLEALFDIRPRWGCFITFPVVGGTVSCKASEPTDLSLYSSGLISYLNENAANQIKAGVFLPNLGDHCGWCGVQQSCAAAGGVNAKDFDPLFDIITKGTDQ